MAKQPCNINRKAISGKYLTDILDNAKKCFEDMNPGHKVEIKYNKDGQYNYFEVYVEMPAFETKAPYTRTTTMAYVTKYLQSAAIDIFASIPKEEFYKKYDDYSVDNMQWLNEQLSHLATAYKLRGIHMYKYHAKEDSWRGGSWRVEFANDTDYEKKKNGGYFDGRGYVSGFFDHVPISENTAKSVLRKVKSSIEAYIKDPNAY